MNTNKQFTELNRFQQLELIGRTGLVEAFPNRDFQFTTGEYDAYDAYIIEDFKISLFEIKIRNASYDDYMLELKKLKALLKIREEFYKKGYITVNIYYINFTPEGVYVWDLDRAIANLKKDISRAAKTTAAPSNKVIKSVFFLPTNRAYYVDYKINKEAIKTKLMANE